MIKTFLKYIFQIDTKSTNRVIIKIFGIKIRFLKPGIAEQAKEKYSNYNITEIPRATGALRKVQLANLKIILIFDELCKKSGLNYWLDYGNLLGAVRHKGFIPWDDDVDVSMLRDDYENFINLYNEGIPNYDELCIDFCNNGRNKCFVKLRHKYLTNITIDIFPYDFYYKKTDYQEKFKITKEINDYLHSHDFIFRLLQPFYINNPTKLRKRFCKIRDEIILKKQKVDKSQNPSLVYGLDYPHCINPLLYDYETIFPLKTIDYEGYELPCPNKIHKFLTQLYGDYMVLPEDCYPRHTNPCGLNGDMTLENFIADLKEKI